MPKDTDEPSALFCSSCAHLEFLILALGHLVHEGDDGGLLAGVDQLRHLFVGVRHVLADQAALLAEPPYRLVHHPHGGVHPCGEKDERSGIYETRLFDSPVHSLHSQFFFWFPVSILSFLQHAKRRWEWRLGMRLAFS